MNTIKVKYGLEEITSRIPGLFPYIEFDENHVSTVHPASDSDCGCYGKIPCSLKIPVYIKYQEDDVIHAKEEYYEVVDDKYEYRMAEEDIMVSDVDNYYHYAVLKDNDENVIISGKIYTYRTLMIVYYKYKDEYPDNPFIQFMERGIGKIKIDAEIDFEYCTLVPEYEYYANCNRLYDEYVKISLMCSKYQQMKQITGEVNCELECLVEKYAKMGGDTMRDYYGNLANTVNDISMEYYRCVSNDFNLSLDLNITATENDLGILNTFVQFFGEKYVSALYAVEERVVPGTNPPIYKTQVVRIVRQVDPQDPTHPRSQDTININEKYYLDDTCVIEAVRGVDYFLPYVDEDDEEHGGDFVIYNDRTYVCERPTINGEWMPNRFRLISENYSDPTPDYNAYYNPNIGVTPADNLSASTNTQLKGFGGETKYTDESGIVRNPEDGTDWLWYYRIGSIGFSETITDKFNNIEVQSGYTRNENTDQYEMHLNAYGDIIRDITRDKDNKTLTITYVIGAHFKAKLLSIEPDDDGNKHYYYSEYEHDSDDSHGVTYTEVFDYEIGDEIDNMSDEFFEYFINHDKLERGKILYEEGEEIHVGDIYYTYDTSTSEYIKNTAEDDIVVQETDEYYMVDPTMIVESRYKKAPFNTSRHTGYGNLMVNGNEAQFSYIISDYTTPIQLNKDGIANPLMRFDYLSGINYKPTVKSDVHVFRGNAAAWERHIRLGEIRTFEDLETYANNSFFNLR